VATPGPQVLLTGAAIAPVGVQVKVNVTSIWTAT
jgi:hypothetical protein